MSEDRKKILEMLSKGKISLDEADALLTALNAKMDASAVPPLKTPGHIKTIPKYLRVEVDSKEDGKNQRVNIKVPFELLRAGVKLAAFMPEEAQSRISATLEKKGIQFDVNNIKAGDLENVISQIRDLSIDVDADNEKVKIYCE